ncbi:MAG TPA: archaemetzincin, partial [Nannocystis sp.]
LQVEPRPAPLRAAFAPGDDDRPIPKPGPHDWLAEHHEPGQTFQQFVLERHNRPDGARRKLIVLPIGPLEGPAIPDLATVSDFAARFFQLEVGRAEPTTMKALRATSRTRGKRQQYHTGSILAAMKPRVPADAFALIGVTLADLYPHPSWNFVFGYASFDERVGVYSFARFDPAFYGQPHGPDTPRLLLRRALGLLVHEVGHMFGLRHCIYYHCIMNGCNHLDESDAAPLHLCPVCRRKLHYSVNYDPLLREQQLAEFFRAHDLLADAERCERRHAAILAATPADGPSLR